MRFNILTHRIGSAFANLPPTKVDAAHAGICGKGNEDCAHFMGIAFAQIEPVLGEHHDTTSLRRLVGKRGKLGGIGKSRFGDANRGNEGGSLAVTQRDGPGLVEQQHIHISRRFHCAA